MFKLIKTSDLIRFINSFRYDKSRFSNVKYNAALDELESRSKLLAKVYRVESE